MRERPGSRRLFGAVLYWGLLPLLVAGNLGVGLFALSYLKPIDWTGWLMLATGAFCCVLAGAIGAMSWSKSYWGAAMRRQLAMWRIVVDTVFAWMETLPLSVEAMNQLKGSLEEQVFARQTPKGGPSEFAHDRRGPATGSRAYPASTPHQPL